MFRHVRRHVFGHVFGHVFRHVFRHGLSSRWHVKLDPAGALDMGGIMSFHAHVTPMHMPARRVGHGRGIHANYAIGKG